MAAGLSWAISYNLNSVQLSVVQSLPGDFNHDGVVDAADFVMWRKTGGSADDYDAWRTNFGEPGGSGSVAGANATVPEPTTLVMLMFAAVGWCGRRGRVA